MPNFSIQYIDSLEAQLASKSMFIRKQRHELNAHKIPLHQRLLTSDSTCHFYEHKKVIPPAVQLHKNAYDSSRKSYGKFGPPFFLLQGQKASAQV